MSTVLVVDDKEMLRDSVAVTLQRPGFTVVTAPDGPTALEAIARRRPDAVVTDLKMPGMTGLELIEHIRGIDADVPIVLMTAFGTIETAVRALKLGAFDYITKPFEGDELIVAVKRAIEHAKLRRENEVLRRSAADHGAGGALVSGGEDGGPRGLDRLIGDSDAMLRLKDKIQAIATSAGTVLVSGESGTGKEVVARAIHDLSHRSGEAFLAVNCAAMSESLLESELFGHERGAFTGAESLRKGRFELAHGGTLLLDEISEIKPQVQAKLLRVLQERAFERVGSSTTIGIDVRVVATTNRELIEEVACGSFRQDLYFRLNVLPLHVPPLRERAGDVQRLAPYFVERASRREGRPTKRLTSEAMSLLMAYPWPGNVRELQNLCDRAVVLSPGEEITAGLIGGWLASNGRSGGGRRFERFDARLPEIGLTGGVNGSGSARTGEHGGFASHASSSAEAKPFGAPGAALATAEGEDAMPVFDDGSPRPLAEIEREVIVRTLEHFRGHRQKTAHALGIGVRTLGLKLKKWKELQLVAQSL